MKGETGWDNTNQGGHTKGALLFFFFQEGEYYPMVGKHYISGG